MNLLSSQDVSPELDKALNPNVNPDGLTTTKPTATTDNKNALMIPKHRQQLWVLSKVEPSCLVLVDAIPFLYFKVENVARKSKIK